MLIYISLSYRKALRLLVTKKWVYYIPKKHEKIFFQEISKSRIQIVLGIYIYISSVIITFQIDGTRHNECKVWLIYIYINLPLQNSQFFSNFRTYILIGLRQIFEKKLLATEFKFQSLAESKLSFTIVY